MEKLFGINTENGISGLLASVCVLLAFQLLFKVGEFLWKIKKEKDQLSEESVKKLAVSMEENTKAIEHLRSTVKELESILAEIPKFKLDMRRLFFAVKTIAGDKWPDIRKEMMSESEL